jgi:hypothetical protein
MKPFGGVSKVGASGSLTIAAVDSVNFARHEVLEWLNLSLTKTGSGSQNTLKFRRLDSESTELKNGYCGLVQCSN